MADRASPNVTWHESGLTRDERWRVLGVAGATVWFTGLSGSGKSTVAAGVEQSLVAAGQPAYMLDGDNLRHGLCGDLGFGAEARAENVRRAAEVARLMADAGMVTLVSLVSPYRDGRAAARELHERDRLPFLEVFMDIPIEECERRDPKGLYARARSGELKGLTGVDDPYEAPETPDLRLGADLAADEAIAAVLEVLRQR